MSMNLKVLQNFLPWFSQGFTHFRYTLILGLASLVGLLRIGIYAHFLDVDEFGLLSKLVLVSSFFSVIGSFGFQLLAQRDLPVEFAAGRYRKGVIILGKACIVTSATALAICLIPFFGLSLLSLSSLAFMFAVLHGWGQQIFMLVVIDSRSRLEMRRYSFQILVRTLLSSTMAVIVAVMGGDAISIIVAEMLITVLISAKIIRHLLNVTQFSIPVFFKLSKKGFNKNEWYVSMVLLAGAVLSFLSISADRWLAADLLSGEDFGLYSFAWISLVTALSIQNLLNAGFFPLLARRRVATGSNTKIRRMTAIFSSGLLVVGLLTAFTVNTLASVIISKWYPKYIEAVPLFLPLLIAASFRVSDFWSTYLIIVHRQNILLATQFLLVFIPSAYYLLNPVRFSWMQTPHSFAILALYLAVGNYLVNGFVVFVSRSMTTS